MGCYGITIKTFKALVATQLRQLLCETPESRSVLMQVFLIEWLVNFPLVDNGRFSVVVLERNWPILFFPIGLFGNQILSSGFRW